MEINYLWLYKSFHPSEKEKAFGSQTLAQGGGSSP
jgi:hypothetical protein